MPAPLQLAGYRQKDGWLEAIRPNKDKPGFWDCKCHLCGGPAVVYGPHIKSGHTKSCNCLKAKTAEKMGRKHGGTRWATVPPKSLIGKRYGKLKVRAFDKERSSIPVNGVRQRFWIVDCNCEREASVQQSNLTSGHTRSCGRCTGAEKNLPNSKEKLKEYARAEEITVDDKPYYSPKKAARYVATTEKTLRLWNPSCPWLKGEGIETILHKGAFNRPPHTYYLKSDLDRIKTAMKKPSKPMGLEGHTPVAEVLTQFNISDETLRRHRKKEHPPIQVVRQLGEKRKDGRACVCCYVPDDFVERLRKKLFHKPAGLTLAEIASRLGYETLEQRIALGVLLKYWRKVGELEASTSHSARGPDTLHYDFNRVKELLAGRDLINTAAELKEYGTISATGHTVQKAKKVKAVPMKRGRKTGRRMQEVIEREKKMCEEWDQGVFGKNKSAAAHAHDFDRGNASRIIAKHEKDRKSV